MPLAGQADLAGLSSAGPERPGARRRVPWLRASGRTIVRARGVKRAVLISGSETRRPKRTELDRPSRTRPGDRA